MNKISRKLSLYALMAVLASYLLGCITQNVHQIDRDVYRSGQIISLLMPVFLHDRQIATVINLRGENAHSNWYRQELRLTRGRHIKHVDIRFASTKLPSGQALRRLVLDLQLVDKPLLLHCAGGEDRSGMAAMVWLLLQGRSIADAAHQISLRYWVVKSDTVGVQLLNRYRHWLADHHWHHSRLRFIQWVEQYR